MHAIALAICGIPITTRSGIEVEDFSPVAMYLSRRIGLVHSIFFWVDIHCYVCMCGKYTFLHISALHL